MPLHRLSFGLAVLDYQVERWLLEARPRLVE
jgi:hypothetical protein